MCACACKHRPVLRALPSTVIQASPPCAKHHLQAPQSIAMRRCRRYALPLMRLPHARVRRLLQAGGRRRPHRLASGRTQHDIDRPTVPSREITHPSVTAASPPPAAAPCAAPSLLPPHLPRTPQIFALLRTHHSASIRAHRPQKPLTNSGLCASGVRSGSCSPMLRPRPSASRLLSQSPWSHCGR